jgi:hypothetical protein
MWWRLAAPGSTSRKNGKESHERLLFLLAGVLMVSGICRQQRSMCPLDPFPVRAIVTLVVRATVNSQSVNQHEAG